MADLTENYEADFIQRGYSDEDMQVLSSSQTGTVVDYADFQKWNSASDASGVDYIPGRRVDVQTDMSLYAQWKMKGKYLQLERYNCTLSSRGNAGQTTDRGQWTIPLKLDWTETSQWELHFRVKPTLNQPFYLCKTTAVTYDGRCKTLAGYAVASEYESYMLPFEIFLLPPGSNDGAEWDSYGTFQQFTKQNSSATNNWLLVVASFANPIDPHQNRSRPAPSTEGFCSTNRNVVAGNSSFSGLTWKYLTDSVQCKCFYVPVKDVWSDVTIQKDGKYVTVNLKPESKPNVSYETTFQLSYIDQKISVPAAQQPADSSYLCLELGGGYQWKEPRFTRIWHEGYTTGTGRYTESTTTIPGSTGTWHFYTKADDYHVNLNLSAYNGDKKYGAVPKIWWCAWCAQNSSDPEPRYAYSEFGSNTSTWPLHVAMFGKQKGRCQFDCASIAKGCSYKSGLICEVNNKNHLPYAVKPSTIYDTAKIGVCGYWKVDPTPDTTNTTRTEITEWHPGYHSTELVGYDTRQTTASPGVWWDFGSTSETYSVLSGEIYFLKA